MKAKSIEIRLNHDCPFFKLKKTYILDTKAAHFSPPSALVDKTGIQSDNAASLPSRLYPPLTPDVTCKVCL